MKTLSGRILFNKEEFYDAVTRQTRWLAIITALITYPFGSQQDQWVLMLTALAVGFNLIQYANRKYSLMSKPSMVITDNIFVLGLLALTGGIYSPYILFLSLTLLSMAYWYGLAPTIGLVALDTIVLVELHRFSPSSPVSFSLPVGLVAVSLSLLTLGWLAERLTHAEHAERDQLSASNRETEGERNRLLSLVNSLADAVIVTDRQNRVQMYNGSALQLLNTHSRLHGQSIDQLLPLINDRHVKVRLTELPSKQKGTFRSRELVYVNNLGLPVNLDITISQVSGLNGQDFGNVIVLRDITQIKSLDQQREEFISIASHELRTPLAIAEANLSTVLLPKFQLEDPAAVELITKAHDNLIFLGELIQDLTTLSRAEQGVLPAEIRRIEPHKLLDQLASDYAEEAASHDIQLKIDAPSNLQPVYANDYQLHEILQNLITNALKYGGTGTVLLKAEAAPDNSLIFSVSDHGAGIAAADQAHIFEKFYRAKAIRDGNTNGTGLGLYIATKLASRMGAKIWFNSKPTKGSTFYLQLPRKSVGGHLIAAK